MIRYTAAVIGLGKIGQGYDYRQRGSAKVLTHAKSFTTHPGYTLVAGVDPNRAARDRFERKFVRPAYTTVRELIREQQPEVIAIGVPTSAHYPVFREAMAGAPRAIICEKPIAATLREARAMIRLAAQRRCTLLVNYMRRFEPGVLALKRALQEKRFGTIYKGIVWYSKGLLNNGSHFIDLLRFLLGDAGSFELIHPGRVLNDDDAEPDVRINFGKCTIYFLAAREECFSTADFELLGTTGRISYRRGGGLIQTWHTAPDPIFHGYRALHDKPQNIENDFNRYQWHVVEHLHHHLTRGTPLNSSGDSATATLGLVQRILSRR